MYTISLFYTFTSMGDTTHLNRDYALQDDLDYTEKVSNSYHIHLKMKSIFACR